MSYLESRIQKCFTLTIKKGLLFVAEEKKVDKPKVANEKIKNGDGRNKWRASEDQRGSKTSKRKVCSRWIGM